PVECRIEQLPAVWAPLRILTAAVGDLPLTAGPWKGLDVDFILSGVVRLKDDPTSIRREPAEHLRRRCIGYRKCGVVIKRHCPQVVGGFLLRTRARMKRPSRDQSTTSLCSSDAHNNVCGFEPSAGFT